MFRILYIALFCAFTTQVWGSTQKVYLRDTENVFLSCEEDQGYVLMLKRSVPGEWQEFTLNKLSDSTFSLFYKDYPVYVDESKKKLFVDVNHVYPPTIFSYKKALNGTVLLSDSFYITSNKRHLSISTKKEYAVLFIVNKVGFIEHQFYKAQNQFWMILACICIILAIMLQYFYGNYKLSLSCLLVGALLLRIFMALLDPALAVWDEQYHALVAKNMLEAPFHPLLYKNAFLSIGKESWVHTTTWLHKPPLFLWQITLSLFAFGNTAFAVRLPSIVISAILVFVLFDMGRMIFNKRIGFIAALLFTVSHFALELGVGYYGTDHNDIVILGYVSLSIWAWVRYTLTDSRKWRWVVVLGMFAGCAVLVKWYVGLFVFLIWASSILSNKEERTNKKNYVHFATSLLLCILIFLPWKMYIFDAFPSKSYEEFGLIGAHIQNHVEGHSGDWTFYLKHLSTLYNIPYWLVIPCLLIGLFSMKRTFSIGFTFGILFVYLFFSIASTKMIAFPIITLSIGLLCIAYTIDLCLSYIQSKNKTYTMIIYSVLIMGLGYYVLDVNKIERNHTGGNNVVLDPRILRNGWVKEYKEIQQKMNAIQDKVFINCPNLEGIQIMFYTDCAAAYDFIPNAEQIEWLQNQGFIIVNMHAKDTPNYIKQDEKIEDYFMNLNLSIL